MLPGAGPDRRRAGRRARRLAAHRADEGPGRWPGRERRAGGAPGQHDVQRRAAGDVQRPARRALQAALRVARAPDGRRRRRLPGDDGADRRALHRHRRSALHQPLGPRLPAGVPAARRAARSLAAGVDARVHGDRDDPRARGHRPPARAARRPRAGRQLRSAEPDLSRAAAPVARPAARGRAHEPSRRGGHRLLHLAQGRRSDRGGALRRRPQGGRVSRRALGRRAVPQPGRVHRRARRRRRRHRRLRDGRRSIGRPLRRARRRPQVARALPAGGRARRPRRPRRRVPAALLVRRLPEVAPDHGAVGRAERSRRRPPAPDGALRRRLPVPPQDAGRALRPDLRGRATAAPATSASARSSASRIR